MKVLTSKSHIRIRVFAACALSASDTEKAREAYKNAEDALMQRVLDLENAVSDLVRAWDVLPGGQRYRTPTVQHWLENTMKPAIDTAREVIK